MSNAIFPTLSGLKWDNTKKPQFSNSIKRSTSGKEVRTAYWSYPIWEFVLSYEVLRDDTVLDELKTLMGFFLQRKGSFDDFLYTDPSDHTITGQHIGVGDGSTRTFQIVRTLGGFVEPIKNLNGAPVIYKDGVLQSSGWSVDSAGIVTFTVAPAAAAVITADFSFYFRCRFQKDEAEFSEFMSDLWELKKCELVSVK